MTDEDRHQMELSDAKQAVLYRWLKSEDPLRLCMIAWRYPSARVLLDPDAAIAAAKAAVERGEQPQPIEELGQRGVQCLPPRSS